MNKIIKILFFLAISLLVNAQSQFKIAEKFNSEMSDSLTKQIIMSLDSLLISIDNEKTDTAFISNKNAYFIHIKYR
ncbi:MAG: hypothetical protein FWF72_04275 [Paludibacter sp.]|nr:hypothetical protein [Paludibacter sp.]